VVVGKDRDVKLFSLICGYLSMTLVIKVWLVVN